MPAASSPSPPHAPYIPKQVFAEHLPKHDFNIPSGAESSIASSRETVGPSNIDAAVSREITSRDYDNFRCETCDRSYCGYLVRPSPNIDDNECAACNCNIMIVHFKLPLPADNIRVPVEETRGHWSASLRRVTVGSNIRVARIMRRITASRRLERQRRGEVPPLAPGVVDVSSNYYTGYLSAVGTKRSFAFGSTNDAKRIRKSQLASVSEDDIFIFICY